MMRVNVVYLLLLSVVLQCPGLAAQVDISGFLDSYHAVRIKNPHDYLSSANRLRLQMQTAYENSSMFVTFNYVDNAVITSQTGLEFREAYAEYVSANWDARLGRQIIVWGKADGIQITDLISPQDFTEFLARDYDDIRMPVDALKLRKLGDVSTVEVVWLPHFTPSIFPEGDNPWAVEADNPEDVELSVDEPLLPDNILKNSEVAGKLSLYLSGIDLAFSALYMWDDLPSLHGTTLENAGTKTLSLTPRYHRLAVGGFEFSMPWSEFIIRGESAFCSGKYFEPDERTSDVIRKNSLNYLIGVDWYPGYDWTLSGQVADNLIIDHDKELADEEHTVISTLSLSKKLLRQTLTLAGMTYYGFSDKDLFGRFSAEYALTDELILSGGVDIFAGDQGEFGQYRDNSEVWVKAKYSFQN